MSSSVNPSLANALPDTFRALRKAFVDSYRPERHYMRGPGPKWREKHEAKAPVYATRVCRGAGAWRLNKHANAVSY